MADDNEQTTQDTSQDVVEESSPAPVDTVDTTTKPAVDATPDDTADVVELAKVNVKLADRKLKLDELRFKLQERREIHNMMIEVRREDFREHEYMRDRDMLTGANEHWMKSYWRPAAGWVYLVICLMDFVIFPFMSMIIPILAKGVGIDMPYTAWTSITLTQGGLIHLSFGAILGVTAWTRGREKLAAVGKL